MNFIPKNGVALSYFATISTKNVEDISAYTKALILDYGRAFTDDQKLSLDDFFVVNQAATHWPKLKSLFMPFLAPPLASITTTSKALKDVVSGLQHTLGNIQYVSVTDKGLTFKGGTTDINYGVKVVLKTAIAIPVSFSAGILAKSVTRRVGTWSLYNSGETIQIGAAGVVTNAPLQGSFNTLIAARKSATSAKFYKEKALKDFTTFNAGNYDTEITQYSISSTSQVLNDTLSFAFVGDDMTEAELLAFSLSVDRLATDFGIVF